MNRRRIMVLGVCLALCAAGVVACAPAQPAPAATPTPASVAVTDDWVVYRDEIIGCTLRYPADAHFEHGVNKFGIYTMRLQFRAPADGGYWGMVIRVAQRDPGGSVDALLRQVYAGGAHQLTFEEWQASLEDITLNGAPAWRTQCTIEGGDFAIIIPHKDRVYVAAPTHGLATHCSDPQALDLFYRVLSTLALD